MSYDFLRANDCEDGFCYVLARETSRSVLWKFMRIFALVVLGVEARPSFHARVFPGNYKARRGLKRFAPSWYASGWWISKPVPPFEKFAEAGGRNNTIKRLQKDDLCLAGKSDTSRQSTPSWRLKIFPFCLAKKKFPLSAIFFAYQKLFPLEINSLFFSWSVRRARLQTEKFKTRKAMKNAPICLFRPNLFKKKFIKIPAEERRRVTSYPKKFGWKINKKTRAPGKLQTHFSCSLSVFPLLFS